LVLLSIAERVFLKARLAEVRRRVYWTNVSTYTKIWIERMDTVVPALLHGTQSQGIANTIVQLIRWSAEGVIARAQATRSEERQLEGSLASVAGLLS
jgi:hypothetical protein